MAAQQLPWIRLLGAPFRASTARKSSFTVANRHRAERVEAQSASLNDIVLFLLLSSGRPDRYPTIASVDEYLALVPSGPEVPATKRVTTVTGERYARAARNAMATAGLIYSDDSWKLAAREVDLWRLGQIHDSVRLLTEPVRDDEALLQLEVFRDQVRDLFKAASEDRHRWIRSLSGRYPDGRSPKDWKPAAISDLTGAQAHAAFEVLATWLELALTKPGEQEAAKGWLNDNIAHFRVLGEQPRWCDQLLSSASRPLPARRGRAGTRAVRTPPPVRRRDHQAFFGVTDPQSHPFEIIVGSRVIARRALGELVATPRPPGSAGSLPRKVSAWFAAEDIDGAAALMSRLSERQIPVRMSDAHRYDRDRQPPRLHTYSSLSLGLGFNAHTHHLASAAKGLFRIEWRRGTDDADVRDDDGRLRPMRWYGLDRNPEHQALVARIPVRAGRAVGIHLLAAGYSALGTAVGAHVLSDRWRDLANDRRLPRDDLDHVMFVAVLEFDPGTPPWSPFQLHPPEAVVRHVAWEPVP